MKRTKGVARKEVSTSQPWYPTLLLLFSGLQRRPGTILSDHQPISQAAAPLPSRFLSIASGALLLAPVAAVGELDIIDTTLLVSVA
jgi:hypothetical protein